MKSFRSFLVIAILVWVAAMLQHGIASQMMIMSARPDFFLILMGASAPFLRRGGGLTLGFFSGLTHGALVGANLTAYIVSRTLAGFILGWSNDLRISPSVLSAIVTTCAATVGTRIMFMFLTAPKDIAGYLADTIASAAYNGVLVIPLYAILSRLLDPVVH